MYVRTVCMHMRGEVWLVWIGWEWGTLDECTGYGWHVLGEIG